MCLIQDDPPHLRVIPNQNRGLHRFCPPGILSQEASRQIVTRMATGACEQPNHRDRAVTPTGQCIRDEGGFFQERVLDGSEAVSAPYPRRMGMRGCDATGCPGGAMADQQHRHGSGIKAGCLAPCQHALFDERADSRMHPDRRAEPQGPPRRDRVHRAGNGNTGEIPVLHEERDHVDDLGRQGRERGLDRGIAIQQADRDLVDLPIRPQSLRMGDQPVSRIRITGRSMANE